MHDGADGPLLTYEVKANMKTLGPKFGNRLKAIQAAIAAADPGRLAESRKRGKRVDSRVPRMAR